MTARTGHPIAAVALTIPSAPNLRDLGGYRTADGARVRRGLLYRSTALDQLEGNDARAFARLGVRIVFDLRTEPERRAAPDQLPDGTRRVIVDVIGDAELGSPAQLHGILNDPGLAAAILGDGRAVAMWEDHFRDFVRLPSARCAYGHLFRDLSREDNRPALVHCSTGKDRTGWAAAAFLLLMGVPEDAVMADYLASGRCLRPVLARTLQAFAEKGGDPELIRPIFGVRPGFLRAAIDEMYRLFGSVGGYFSDGLGVSAPVQRALREAFLEPAPPAPSPA